MKSKGILPDTCAWIDYFKSTESKLGTALEQALAGEQVHVCGTVLYELVQGVKSEKEQALLQGALRALPYLEMTPPLWVKAARLSADLRKQGKTLPFSDLLIAALALENNLAVLTVDRHFKEIPKLVVMGSDG